ncbi:hypothetical protein LY76DRAFT_77815 [Colletotrichum caudatum]|nr:hypothetical protein LY76DRAFT_77815 [Colletotrichum caudatum]
MKKNRWLITRANQTPRAKQPGLFRPSRVLTRSTRRPLSLSLSLCLSLPPDRILGHAFGSRHTHLAFPASPGSGTRRRWMLPRYRHPGPVIGPCPCRPSCRVRRGRIGGRLTTRPLAFLSAPTQPVLGLLTGNPSSSEPVNLQRPTGVA